MATAFLLTACSSSAPINSAYQLIPQSSTDGSKRFAYQFQTSGSHASIRNPSGSFILSSPQVFTDMEDQLEREIERSGFCLEGFFVYDQTFDGTTYRLLGECRD